MLALPILWGRHGSLKLFCALSGTLPVRFQYAKGSGRMTDFESMTPQEFKAWENRMRRRLAVQGMILSRSRSRLPVATDYGLYNAIDTATNTSLSNGYTLHPADVERWAAGPTSKPE